jgi:hypothetical protein
LAGYWPNADQRSSDENTFALAAGSRACLFSQDQEWVDDPAVVPVEISLNALEELLPHRSLAAVDEICDELFYIKSFYSAGDGLRGQG